MSYIALMAAQAKPRHIGYSMQVRELTSGADVLAVSRAAHDRMHPPSPVIRLARSIAIEPEPEPEPIVDTPHARRPRDFIFLRRIEPKYLGPKWRHVDSEQIVAEVCIKHRVSIAQVKGSSRLREVVTARFEAFYRISEELGYSLPMIGRAVGNRDHSGVLHGIRRHKARLEAAGL